MVSYPAGYIAYISTQDSTTEYDYFPVNNLTSVSAGYRAAAVYSANIML